MNKSEKGQALPVLLAVVAVVISMTLLVAKAGNLIALRALAQNAADATALAGVSGGKKAAEEIAQENGAEIVFWTQGSDDVLVKIRLQSHVATARAESGPSPGRADP